MEDLPQPNPDPIGIPDAMLVRPTIVVVFDAVKDTITVVTPVRPQDSVAADTAFARARERLSAIIDALDAPLAASPAHRPGGPLTVWPSSNTTPAEYERMVERGQGYIAAGDIFQVVLSQRFEAPFELPPFALYRALRRVNPAPISLFPRLRRLLHCRIEPGNPGAGARRHRHHPADRGHPAARRDPAARTRRSTPNCWPIQRSAPNT